MGREPALHDLVEVRSRPGAEQRGRRHRWPGDRDDAFRPDRARTQKVPERNDVLVADLPDWSPGAACRWRRWMCVLARPAGCRPENATGKAPTGSARLAPSAWQT
jgi:hypothetical protein